MSKNIFLFNQISKQNDFEVNNLTVNQDLKLTGAESDCLLSTDANSNVVTFNNGPSRYLLEIDPLTLKPKWTNNILVDDITVNEMTINNTQQADLLVIGDGLGSVERLPRGPNNYVLCSDNLTFGLNYKSIYQLLNLQAGNLFADNSGIIYSEKPTTYTLFSSTFSTSTPILNVQHNVVINRKYKITCNFINTQLSGQNFYNLSVSSIGILKNYFTTTLQSSETLISFYTAINTGTDFISLTGTHNPTSEVGTATRISLIVEPLGY